MEAPDEPLPVDAAIAVVLIVNELLTNSLKYAFTRRGSGHIIVILDKKDGQYRLEVGDDGGGIESDAIIDEASTLGMKIVVALVSQLSGTIAYHTEGGAVFSLTFPESATPPPHPHEVDGMEPKSGW